LKTGQTPFWIACYHGETEIVKLVFNHERTDVNKARKNGFTPLLTAYYCGDIEIVKYTLSSGIEIDDEDTKTALNCAKEKGKTEMVELMESFQRKESR